MYKTAFYINFAFCLLNVPYGKGAADGQEIELPLSGGKLPPFWFIGLLGLLGQRSRSGLD